MIYKVEQYNILTNKAVSIVAEFDNKADAEEYIKLYTQVQLGIYSYRLKKGGQ